MDFGVLFAVGVGALVPTIANGIWEWFLARGTRDYVDRRVTSAEAKAQKDRDAILVEAKSTRERVEALIAALQAPAQVAPEGASPGFAHGAVDPLEAVEAREAKKAARKQRRFENAAAVAEALGEKSVFAKKAAEAMGFDWNELLDSPSTDYVVGIAKKLIGGSKFNGNGNGHGVVSVDPAWR